MNCALLGCDVSDTHWCSGCKCVKYCSKEHQREDWTTHKNECVRLKSLPKITKDEFGLSLSVLGYQNCIIVFPKQLFRILCRICLVWDAGIVIPGDDEQMENTMGNSVINDINQFAAEVSFDIVKKSGVYSINDFISKAIQCIVFTDIKFAGSEYELLTCIPRNTVEVLTAPPHIVEWWKAENPDAVEVLNAMSKLYRTRQDITTQI